MTIGGGPSNRVVRSSVSGSSAMPPIMAVPSNLTPMALIEESPSPKRERWTAQWSELFDEVITTGLCTGCAGCVISCPHDVIGYNHEVGHYKPFHLEDELGPADGTHGQKGCTPCTRAGPRFRSWEADANDHLFGHDREASEMY